MEGTIYAIHHKQQQDDVPNLQHFYDKITRCLQGSKPSGLSHAKLALLRQGN